MNAFVWDDGRRLEFLDQPVADALIMNRPLRAHQDDALGPPRPPRIRALADIPPQARDFLLVRGHVFLTRRLARRFAQAARASGAKTAVLALEPCVFTRSTRALMDLEDDAAGRTLYGVYFRGAPGPPTTEELLGATPVALSVKEHPVPNDMLARRGLQAEGFEVALTTGAILHIRHWSHLVIANYVALFCYWFDLTPRKLVRYLGALVRAGWPSRHRLMRALTVRGQGCNIHPSAVVEASLVGNQVEIGPCAVVRGCVLGDRVKIDAFANVNYASIGEGGYVSFHTVCNLSVLYPQAMLCQIGAQMSLLGPRATVLSGSLLMDLRDPYLHEEVKVLDGGQRVPSGRKLLGPLIGQDAIVGAGVTVAPGVVVPAGAYLVQDPDGVVRNVDRALAPRQAHRVHEGGLTPVKK